MKSVVKIKFGSHLYGTATENSDIDIKEVFIPNGAQILLSSAPESFRRTTKEGYDSKNDNNDVDVESYSLKKFFNLLIEGQTVALDMLFAPEWALISSSPLWESIQQNKEHFLSKKVSAFLGYCKTQANKYGIKGSRVNTLSEVVKCLQSEYKANPEERLGFAINKNQDLLNLEHVSIVPQLLNNNQTINYFECCGRKMPFTAYIKYALEVYEKVYSNYGERARAAQINEGIDWKALSHAVRVGLEGIELLTTKNITFPCPHRDHLLSIKKGELPYNIVAHEIEYLLKEIEMFKDKSPLPDEIDMEYINNLIISEYKSAVLAM